jgi:hypothetical protein
MDKFMESTNHNLWTLTKHVAHSVNKTAGKIDVTIYGKKTNALVQVKAEPTPKAVIQVQPKAPEKPIDPNAPSGIGFIIAIGLLVGCGIYFLRRKIRA